MRQVTEIAKPRYQTLLLRLKPPHLQDPRWSPLPLPIPLPLALRLSAVTRLPQPLQKARQPVPQPPPSRRHPEAQWPPLSPTCPSPMLLRPQRKHRQSLLYQKHRKPPLSDTTQGGPASSSPAKLPSSRPTTLSRLYHPYTKIRSSSESTLASHSSPSKDPVDDSVYTL